MWWRHLGLGFLLACGTTTAVETPPPPPVRAADPAPRPPPPPPPPPPVVETNDGAMAPAEYGVTLLREFRLRNRSRPVEATQYEALGDAPAHEVHAFRRIGRNRSHLALTVGLGRVSRPGGTGLPNLELFAESGDYARPIADVLAALGRALHGKETGVAFKPYGSVSLTEPQHNLQYFDLVPAGQIDVAEGHVVMLMKVVPVSADEFEQTEEGETQFAGRDDVTPTGARRALMRWAPALSQGSEEP